jgi:N-acetylmuramoyl-L-alanine amidase
MRIVEKPSPNFFERKSGLIDILLLHYTGMPICEGAIEWLCNPKSEVSSHYTITESGDIYRHVDEKFRAQHAGLSFWAGESDINSRSIGIEICNPGHDHGYRDFPKKQIAVLIDLCHEIIARHKIPLQRVLAHSDVAPTRKRDPGEKFPWEKLAQKGIGHWIKPEPLGKKGVSFKRGDRGAHISAMQRMFSIYGYGIDISGIFDEKTEFVVTAFQRHFRQKHVDGIADPSTIATLHKLIKALPAAG